MEFRPRKRTTLPSHRLFRYIKPPLDVWLVGGITYTDNPGPRCVASGVGMFPVVVMQLKGFRDAKFTD